MENRFEEITKELIEMLSKKNNDYSGKSEDRYKNIRMPELFGICKTEEAVLARICDKISRVNNIIKDEKSIQIKNESKIDNLKDIAGYCIILICYIKDKEMEVSKWLGFMKV